ALKFASPLYIAVMKCLSAVSPDVVHVTIPLAFKGMLYARVVVLCLRVPGLGTKYTVSVSVTVPVGVVPGLPVLVTATVYVMDCPVTTLRTSGADEVSAT